MRYEIFALILVQVYSTDCTGMKGFGHATKSTLLGATVQDYTRAKYSKLRIPKKFLLSVGLQTTTTQANELNLRQKTVTYT